MLAMATQADVAKDAGAGDPRTIVRGFLAACRQSAMTDALGRRRLRVLVILFNLEVGGGQRAVLDFLGALDRQHYEPALLLAKREGIYWEEISPDVSIHYLVDEGRRFRGAVPRIVARLVPACSWADVVIGGLEGDSTLFAWAGGWVTRKPTIGWVHVSLKDALSTFSPLQRRLSRWLYPRLTSIVCVSEGAARSLQAVTGVPAGRVRVIFPPVNLARVTRLASANPPPWAAELMAEPTILSAGRLIPLKRFDLLIRAHAMLLGRGIAHRLVILGDGPLRRDLEVLARGLGVEGTVSFPGFVSNPYPIMRRATVAALASDHEGLPLVLVEALALGVPVVATAAAAEVLGDGRFGMLGPRGDAEALAGACGRLLTDVEARRRLAVAGIVRARVFDTSTTMAAWHMLLQATVAKARSNASSGAIS
jgi:glycosyltransferase involved in cell wall biosynthesis